MPRSATCPATALLQDTKVGVDPPQRTQVAAAGQERARPLQVFLRRIELAQRDPRHTATVAGPTEQGWLGAHVDQADGCAEVLFGIGVAAQPDLEARALHQRAGAQMRVAA